MKTILTSLFVLLLLISLPIATSFVWNTWLRGASSDTVQLEIASGTSARAIAGELGDQRIVNNTFWYKVYLRLSGRSSELHAGVFSLPRGASYKTITDILSSTQAREEFTLTIPEGYTMKQIGEELAAISGISQEKWRAATELPGPFSDHPLIVRAEEVADLPSLEGYFFPDTYRFFTSATAEDVAKTLLDTMQERVVIHPNLSLHDSITLASIVQREVLTSDQMEIVAGIFFNRLEIGMALQSDATVNYVTGKKTTRPSFDDLAVESAYNTYRNTGLPPGPVASPGLDALQAVANPTSHNYFFFLTTPAGEPKYAETLEGHIVNRNLFLE
ncbi:MAG: endolytic transglycosylase MltG [bacterium]|nr:endolytic transglycosylase MltG [bacterium]